MHGCIARLHMSGYTENLTHPPTAISYLEEDTPRAEAEYNYLTRRPFEIEKDIKHNLVCVGGPTSPLYTEITYTESDEYPEHAIQELDAFLRSTYKHAENKSQSINLPGMGSWDIPKIMYV